MVGSRKRGIGTLAQFLEGIRLFTGKLGNPNQRKTRRRGDSFGWLVIDDRRWTSFGTCHRAAGAGLRTENKFLEV